MSDGSVERRGDGGELLGRVWWAPHGPATVEGWHASFPGDWGEPCIFKTREEAVAFMDEQILAHAGGDQ